MRLLKRVAAIVGNVALVAMALFALGALAPALPLLGSLGPLLVSPFGSWIVLLSLVGVVVKLRRWWLGRRPRNAMMAGIAAVAAIGTGIAEARQIAVAHANGLSINLAKTLWIGPQHHSSAAPVVVSYGQATGQPLDVAIYRPAPAREAAPILVYVHGGGWVKGTVLDREPDMQWFADRGFLVVSVGYTLSSDEVHAWNLAEPQVGCALAWVGSHAARLDADPTRLALFGESAGGNLVVNVSYKIAAGRLRPSCVGALPRVRAVVAPYPVLDPVEMHHNHDLLASLFASTMTTRYTGGAPEQLPERFTTISSIDSITPGAPPTLLFPALADHLLPPATAFAFAGKAQAAGIDVRVIAVPAAEHAFDLRSGSVGNQIVRDGTLQFLARHGLAPQP